MHCETEVQDAIKPSQHEERRQAQGRAKSKEWNASYQDDSYHTSHREPSDGGNASNSEWNQTSKDAKLFLKKQTEQAYDFAKTISLEDAKKGASETAKKAKKWGGSLLSSISASISNATNVMKVQFDVALMDAVALFARLTHVCVCRLCL